MSCLKVLNRWSASTLMYLSSSHLQQNKWDTRVSIIFNPWQSRICKRCFFVPRTVDAKCPDLGSSLSELCQVYKPSIHVAIPRHVLSKSRFWLTSPLNRIMPMQSCAHLCISHIKAGLSTSNWWESISTCKRPRAAQARLSSSCCSFGSSEPMSHQMCHRMSYDVLRLVKLRHWM